MQDKTKRMIKKYGRDACVEAFKLHGNGMGGSSVGLTLGVRTNTADALISAGRELDECNSSCLICEEDIRVVFCCSGWGCGCMGQAIDPPVCSKRCFNAVMRGDHKRKESTPLPIEVSDPEEPSSDLPF